MATYQTCWCLHPCSAAVIVTSALYVFFPNLSKASPQIYCVLFSSWILCTFTSRYHSGSNSPSKLQWYVCHARFGVRLSNAWSTNTHTKNFTLLVLCAHTTWLYYAHDLPLARRSLQQDATSCRNYIELPFAPCKPPLLQLHAAIFFWVQRCVLICAVV